MTPEGYVEALGSTLQSAGWLEILKPALKKEIDDVTDMWLTGKRLKSDPHVTDEGLKQRIVALKWMLSWEDNYKRTVERLVQDRQVAAQTEPAVDGRALY